MQGVLHAHNDILRRALANHGGVEVKSQGDGFMLAFADPVAAVGFALDFEHAIDGTTSANDAGTVRVRVGVHTGVVLREGDDFFGRTVIVAATGRGSGKWRRDPRHGRRPERSSATRSSSRPSREVELKGFSGTRTVHPVAR